MQQRAALLVWFLALPAVAGELTFAAYNVENYLHVAEPKPGKAKASVEALVATIKEIDPDVLGLCEVGHAADWQDLRDRLEAAGLRYTDFAYVEAADPDRHLALASRLPILAQQSATDVTYVSDGVRQKVRRGFLDVTIQAAPGYELRVIGAHLKSRLEGPGDEALLRRHEAHLLHEHVEAALAEKPELNLLVYGDLNSAPQEPAMAELIGTRGSPRALTDLRPADATGDRWTHYWETADVYSRIDYLLASRGLLPEIVRTKCRIPRRDNWARASDHRPVVATVRTEERR